MPYQIRQNRRGDSDDWSKNRKMNPDTYVLRRKVMDYIYRAKKIYETLTKQRNWKRINIRIVDLTPEGIKKGLLGYAFLEGFDIRIPAATTDYKPEILHEVIFHELLHAIYGIGHDENNRLMKATVDGHLTHEQIDEMFSDYIKKLDKNINKTNVSEQTITKSKLSYLPLYNLIHRASTGKYDRTTVKGTTWLVDMVYEYPDIQFHIYYMEKDDLIGRDKRTQHIGTYNGESNYVGGGRKVFGNLTIYDKRFENQMEEALKKAGYNIIKKLTEVKKMKLTKEYLKNLIAEVLSEQEDEKEKDGKKILNDDDISNVNDVSTGRWHADDIEESTEEEECSECVAEDCNECGDEIKEAENEPCDDFVAENENCEGCEEIEEVAPPGWEGTVKAMKKHPEITNPWALSWYMKNKGYESHK